MIEPLESRCFLSATLDPASGVLTVNGTNHGDKINVSSSGKNLRVGVNQTVNNFTAAEVKSVHINGGDASDKITVAAKVATVINGDNGNDVIIAGPGTDMMFGDAGDDTFIPDNTKTGDDSISGGAGFDTVDYSNSTIGVRANVGGVQRAATVNDIIQSDIEFIRGSQFADTLTNGTKHPLKIFGGKGNDTLTGGSGDDTIDGGTGIDSILGNGGGDHLRTKDGQIDIVDGGSGKDILEDFDRLGVIDSISNIP